MILGCNNTKCCLKSKRYKIENILKFLIKTKIDAIFFFQIDLMAFLLMTEKDLKTIGIDDINHRKIFVSGIEKYCGIL